MWRASVRLEVYSTIGCALSRGYARKPHCEDYLPPHDANQISNSLAAFGDISMHTNAVN